MVFYQKRGCVLKHNYAAMCRGSCSYDLVHNFFDIAFAIAKFSFCGALLKRILEWEQGISQR